MRRRVNPALVRLGLGLMAFGVGAPVSAQKAERRQPPPPRITSRDSVALPAGKRYEAGSFTRFFLGNTYRDLWTTPVRAPVLDLEHYAGGRLTAANTSSARSTS